MAITYTQSNSVVLRRLEPKPYASEDYQTILDGRGMTCSMSRRGNCFDNAVMESFFSTVKSELGERFEGYGVAKEQLFDYIEVFYNQQRRYSTLGQVSPAAFERRAAEGQAAWSTRPPKRINATWQCGSEVD